MALSQPIMSSAPKQEHMSVTNQFGQHQEGLMVKQTMKGCLRNCCGCQAQTEYKISGLDWKYLNSPMEMKEARESLPDKLHVLEDSLCLLRCCWRDGRPLTFNVTEGPDGTGAPVLKYEKKCGLPLYCTIPIPIGGDDNSGGDNGGSETVTVDCPCCCMLPDLTTIDQNGQELSNSRYLCDAMSMCIPKLMYSEGGQDVYYLAPDTCCGGCCVKPHFRGCRKVTTIPFYFCDPQTKERICNANGKHPKISKVWAGAKKECCSTADTFATMFPDGIDNNRKAGLLGLTLLLDFTVFEKQGQPGADLALPNPVM